EGGGVRMLQVGFLSTEVPQDDPASSSGWELAEPIAVPQFSATCYFFAQRLHQTLGVPVGVISSAFSDTPIEAWMSREALERVQEVAPISEPSPTVASGDRKRPAALFNGMVHPIAPFRIRGVAWYQGEANVANAEQYEGLLRALIEDWRRAFRQD